MSNLKNAIEKLLIENLGFKKNDWRLAMAEPIAKVIGDVPSPQEIAGEIFLKITEDETIPPEISHRGPKNIYTFLSAFDYDYIKKVLLKAAYALKN